MGAWHYGDEEPQSIFWGETATDIIPISYNDYLGSWIVDSITDGDWEDRKLPRYDDLSKLVDWIVANFTQYRKLLGASTPHK
jgi:hypothetical protein